MIAPCAMYMSNVFLLETARLSNQTCCFCVFCFVLFLVILGVKVDLRMYVKAPFTVTPERLYAETKANKHDSLVPHERIKFMLA